MPRLARLILVATVGATMWACADTVPDPVNVHSTTFFDQSCPRSHVVYTVPEGKLLILEDASASAFQSATASELGNPGILGNIPVKLSLRTNPTGSISFGSADHLIVGGIGLPAFGGRTIKGYAAPGTNVLFLIGGCTVDINTSIQFAGRLVSFP